MAPAWMKSSATGAGRGEVRSPLAVHASRPGANEFAGCDWVATRGPAESGACASVNSGETGASAARPVRDQGVAGSNPVSPTIIRPRDSPRVAGPSFWSPQFRKPSRWPEAWMVSRTSSLKADGSLSSDRRLAGGLSTAQQDGQANASVEHLTFKCACGSVPSQPSRWPLRAGAKSSTQAPPGGLSASRIQEIRTCGLNGGPVSVRKMFNSHRPAGGRTYP